MTLLKHFLRWLFNLPEFGAFNGDERLYRRFTRTRQVQQRQLVGWFEMPEHTWFKFVPDEYPNKSIPMPNGQKIFYTNGWRSEIGEFAFEKWVDNHRREALEEMLVKNLERKL